MFKIVKIWLKYGLAGAQSQLLNNWSGLLFIIGKLVRFLLYFIFIYSIMSQSKSLAQYSEQEVIIVFLVFTLVDSLIQVIFRGVYSFRPIVVSGNFDLDLLKPLPSFFRPIFGVTDILDAITLGPFIGYFVWYVINQNVNLVFFNFLLFLVLLMLSLVLAFAINLIIASVGLLTTEVDHLTGVYRDLEAMARFPVDIYTKGFQYLITFVVPVAVLIFIPAQALLGLLKWQSLGLALGVTLGFFIFASQLWKYALKQYTSASS